MKDKVTSEKLFEIYCKVYEKNYDSSLSMKRFNTFKTNLDSLQNKDSNITHEMGFTPYFDLSDEEFMEIAGIQIYQPKVSIDLSKKEEKKSSYQIYQPIDLRKGGCISKDPKQKNDEYIMNYSTALALTTLLEYNYCKKNNNVLTPLALQQFIDCNSNVKDFYDKYDAFLYNTGLVPASKYDAFTGNRGVCNTSISGAIKNYYWEYPAEHSKVILDTDTIIEALKRGPLVAGFNFYRGLNKYTGGIYTPADSLSGCAHYCYFTVIGYGIDPNQKEYWILKSYLGQSWGYEGVFYLARNEDQMNYGLSCGFRKTGPV